MKIEKYSLIEGARKAEGLAVIIDVFRAFSLECYLHDMGAREIRPVKEIEEAFAWREKDSTCLLVGERHGKMCEGFDYGNSPSVMDPERIRGRRVIHTTSAGTQGITNALQAEEIITGSFVNAKAVAKYIKAGGYERVSLVAMGKEGVKVAKEDELCADHIESMLLGGGLPESEGETLLGLGLPESKGETLLGRGLPESEGETLPGPGLPDIKDRLEQLRFDGGDHFFTPEKQSIYPEKDFWMCIDLDRFDFVIRVRQDADGLISEKVSV